MGSLKRVSTYLVMGVAILTAAIFLTLLGSWLFYFAYAKLASLNQLVQIDFEALSHQFNQLMVYLLSPFSKQLNLADFKMSASGLLHFKEVKRLMLISQICLLIFGSLAIYRWQQLKRDRKTWLFVQFLKLMMVLPAVFALMAVIDFDQFFIYFHQIFFRNLAWQFDPALDPIILVLPEGYFMGCFIIFGVIYETLCFYFLKKSKQTLNG